MVVFTGERTGSAGSRDAARYQHPAFSFVSPYFIESQGSHFCIYILPHLCELLFLSSFVARHGHLHGLERWDRVRRCSYGLREVPFS